ncbi:MAG TPA: SRPBCC domain-containing protein [Ramlibacter sp.]|nr:SRPBCC domain-containing protein [Ramlibacter sp.]
MPRREATFTVNAPPGELWKFIRDFESLCTCIPGVERIKVVDDKTAELTVKEKIGVVPMILDLRAQIESENPPHELHAIAKAQHLMMQIDVTLRPNGSGTELVTVFDVKGEGQLKGIVDSLFEKRATERTAQFANTLQSHFGAVAPAAVPAPAPEGWLTRLWRRLRQWFAPAKRD